MKRRELDSEKDRTKAKDISQGAGCPSQLRKASDLELEGGCSGFQMHLYPGFQITHSSRERQMPPGRALQRGEDVGLLRMAMSAQPSLARAGAWEGGGRHQTHPRQAGSTRTRPVSIGWKRCDCCVRVSQLRWVHSVPHQGGENPQEQEGKALNLPPSSQGQLSTLWYLEKCLPPRLSPRAGQSAHPDRGPVCRPEQGPLPLPVALSKL